MVSKLCSLKFGAIYSHGDRSLVWNFFIYFFCSLDLRKVLAANIMTHTSADYKTATEEESTPIYMQSNEDYNNFCMETTEGPFI